MAWWVHDGLWDHVNDFHMGISAELVAKKYKVNREDSDAFALNSYEKCWIAQNQGKLSGEIVPVEIPSLNGDPVIFDTDEVPIRKPLITMECLKKLQPAFQKDGLVTAGNASEIADGAAALVVMSREKADALGCKPLVRMGAQGASGMDMKYVLMAPILSIPKVLAKDGLKVEDIDLHEINEVFSTSAVAINRELSIDPFQGKYLWRVRGHWTPHWGQRRQGVDHIDSCYERPGRRGGRDLPLSGGWRSRDVGGL